MTEVKFRKDKKMSMRSFFKWFILLLPILNIFTLVNKSYIGIHEVIVEVICCLASFAMITFVVCRDKICPICKKPFALKETSKEVISKENISVQIENKIRNREGKVTGTAEQYVPGIKTTYNVYYTCRFCGKVTCRTFVNKKPLN